MFAPPPKERITPQLQKDLDIARSKIFMHKDLFFLSNIMCLMEFHWSKDPENPTVCNNGKECYWDIDHFYSMTSEQRVIVLAHELWHVARLHALRRQERDPEIWNIACDIVINRELLKSGFPAIPNWVHDPSIKAESEEEVYDLLLQRSETPSMPVACPCNQQAAYSGDDHTGNGMTPTQIIQATVNTVAQAIQIAKSQKNYDDSVANIESILQNFLSPKIPWETKLRRYLRALKQEDYSWRRPNRRYTEMYLPSRVHDETRLENLVYYFDVSGSISDEEIEQFYAEIFYIRKVLKPAKITVVQFSTTIVNEAVLEDGKPLPEIIIGGRGGTMIRPVMEHMKNVDATAAVIFTDMCFLYPAGKPRIPVIWVSTEPNVTIPFGDLVYFER